MSTAYTDVGRRAWTGHYAVTADAYRKPGKVHALNHHAGSYLALCGVRIARESDDHFLQDEPQVTVANPGHRITCRRCLKVLGALEPAKTRSAKAAAGG